MTADGSDGKIIDFKAWSVIKCDGFCVVGHRGSKYDRFCSVQIPIEGTEQVLILEGEFNLVEVDGIGDTLQIHSLKDAQIAE